MTFEDIKAYILDKAKKGGLCESFHDVYIASDITELTIATKPLFTYGWRGNIVNTDILDEVDPEVLISNGIYYNLTGVQSPANNLVIIGGTPEIEFTGTDKYYMNVITSNPIITVDGPYLKSELLNSEATFNINSVSEIYSNNFNSQLITVNAEGYVSIFAEHQSNLNINFGDQAFVKLFMRKNSLAQLSIGNEDNRIFARTSDKSQINYAEL